MGDVLLCLLLFSVVMVVGTAVVEVVEVVVILLILLTSWLPRPVTGVQTLVCAWCVYVF